MNIIKKINIILSIFIIILLSSCHEHIDNHEYTYDENYHYYICECGEKVSESHTFLKIYDEYEVKYNYVCSVCAFVKDNNNHIHQFKEIIDEKYLAYEATCTTPKKYYLSCECGTKSDETFEIENSYAHSNNFICNLCNSNTVDENYINNFIAYNIDQLSFEFKDFTLSFDSITDNIVTTLSCDSLKVNYDNNELSAYGLGKLSIIDTQKYEYKTKVVIIHGILYLYIDIRNNDITKYIESDYIIYNDNNTMILEAKIDKYIELFNNYKKIVNVVWSKIYSKNKNEIINFLTNMLDNVATINKIDNEYNIKIDNAQIKNISNDFIRLPLKEAFDKNFGEAKFDDLSKYILNLFDMSISDIIKELRNKGLSISTIFNVLDEIIFISTNGEYKSFLEYISSKDSDSDFGSILDFIFSNDIKDLTIVEFIAKYFDYDLLKVKSLLEEVVIKADNFNIIEIILAIIEEDYKEERLIYVTSEVERISNKATDSFCIDILTNKNGNVKELLFNFDLEGTLDEHKITIKFDSVIDNELEEIETDITKFLDDIYKLIK